MITHSAKETMGGEGLGGWAKLGKGEVSKIGVSPHKIVGELGTFCQIWNLLFTISTS